MKEQAIKHVEERRNCSYAKRKSFCKKTKKSSQIIMAAKNLWVEQIINYLKRKKNSTTAHKGISYALGGCVSAAFPMLIIYPFRSSAANRPPAP